MPHVSPQDDEKSSITEPCIHSKAAVEFLQSILTMSQCFSNRKNILALTHLSQKLSDIHARIETKREEKLLQALAKADLFATSDLTPAEQIILKKPELKGENISSYLLQQEIDTYISQYVATAYQQIFKNLVAIAYLAALIGFASYSLLETKAQQDQKAQELPTHFNVNSILAKQKESLFLNLVALSNSPPRSGLFGTKHPTIEMYISIHRHLDQIHEAYINALYKNRSLKEDPDGTYARYENFFAHYDQVMKHNSFLDSKINVLEKKLSAAEETLQTIAAQNMILTFEIAESKKSRKSKKPRWYVTLAALSLFLIGIGLCVTGIGSFLGLPIIYGSGAVLLTMGILGGALSLGTTLLFIAFHARPKTLPSTQPASIEHQDPDIIPDAKPRIQHITLPTPQTQAAAPPASPSSPRENDDNFRDISHLNPAAKGSITPPAPPCSPVLTPRASPH